ncbi:unnamed protein product [Arctia plantaginis]|uniref:SURP motif domain-containing protein n=1 Tax=Arctia plantaginis TaxID=874455 RepID=A0A8S1AKM2_ARCPL|nr:unnamed protein product [Arctia plantaginis]
MSVKWTGSQSESGILRKSEYKEKKEDLFVFGYSCKLFRDDDKALHIDQGKHLIPWMGDETLKIDRYDARGALHDLSRLEAPPGGYDWRVELTKDQQDVEQLCDDERYRALHTNEDEEEMYKEEELKRLHAAGYGQVGFNYETPAEPSPSSQPTTEVDEPYIPTPAFRELLPSDIVFPETIKLNAIIEKTANFIATQGAQMEILIKAKQSDNPQFQFLAKESNLHPYYSALIALVKSGKWPEKDEEVEEKPEQEPEEYLHPSLASTIIESAPAIPSIHYKPSADCDYTMLISKMRGEGDGEGEGEARGDVPPPGTEPPRHTAEIYRAPVMYTRGADGNHVDPTVQPAVTQNYMQQYATYYPQNLAQEQEQQKQLTPGPLKSTGLSLMKHYNTDSDSDSSDFDDSSSTDSKEPAIATPPDDVQIVIDKMASYVARNGDEFVNIVRAKNDPRFTFLDPDNVYHAYYKKLMLQKRGGETNGKEKKKKSTAPVSFSIKKLKEPDPILPKPALPYESSSDEDSEKQNDKQPEKPEEIKETPKVVQPVPMNLMPPVVVYKIDGQLNNDLPAVKTIEPPKPIVIKPPAKPITIKPEVKIEILKAPIIEEKAPVDVEKPPIQAVEEVKNPTPEPKEVKLEKDRESPYKREKKKHRDKKKEYRSKSESREVRRNERRSLEREKKREKDTERENKKSKYSKDDLENEVISLEDNSDDLIDLTGDQSDSKVEETEAERAKQQERRRRAAEFLKKVGVDPSAAQLPTSSLASAMVDTLESIRKKKAEEEEKRRRRDKRRHRDRRDYGDGNERSHRKSKRRKYKSTDENEDSDYDSSKKKKRKKDRKHSSKNKKKRKQDNEVDEEDPPVLNIDLTNTLKELRNSSPTKELGLQDVEKTPQSLTRQESSDEELVRVKRKTEREYSEGEWSSDSEGDSKSSASKDD